LQKGQFWCFICLQKLVLDAAGVPRPLGPAHIEEAYEELTSMDVERLSHTLSGNVDATHDLVAPLLERWSDESGYDAWATEAGGPLAGISNERLVNLGLALSAACAPEEVTADDHLTHAFVEHEPRLDLGDLLTFDQLVDDRLYDLASSQVFDV
jgi:hypothetical protein